MAQSVGPATPTAKDIFSALSKRLSTQGHALRDTELLSLTIDVMNVINNDATNATAHAALEIVYNPVRPFLLGV